MGFGACAPARRSCGPDQGGVGCSASSKGLKVVPISQNLQFIQFRVPGQAALHRAESFKSFTGAVKVKPRRPSPQFFDFPNAMSAPGIFSLEARGIPENYPRAKHCSRSWCIAES